MDIRFHTIGKGNSKLDCVIVPTFEDTRGDLAAIFGKTASSWLVSSPALADHTAAKDQITICYGPSDCSLPRAILIGLGSKEKLTLAGYRLAIGTAIKRCRVLGLARAAMMLACCLPVAKALGKNINDIVQETVLAVLLASYSCTEYRSSDVKKKAQKQYDPAFFSMECLHIAHEGMTIPGSLRSAVHLAEAEAAGVCLARDLVNAPANIITPARMGEEALALARRYGFNCRVIHKAEMAKLGMGALLAVSEGSHKDACFVVLEYSPTKAKKKPPIVLVGKGITYDTGGISLKPAAGMHRMKGDMAGAAAVLGVFEAIGRYPESVSQSVVGLLPCVENMPGGGATRPGDVVTTMSGKTVEILNTDAEGRLILCDALTYAQRYWKAGAMVDIATLTGACAVALGTSAGGLFCDHKSLCNFLLEESGNNGDRLWHMPLWEDFGLNLKSDIADMSNVGPREGGAITAALFLKAFVDNELPWAHLDIAGTGLAEKETPLCPSGGTGFGVRSLLALARKAAEGKFTV